MAEVEDLKSKLQELKTIEEGVASNKVAQFAYTQKAYTEDKVDSHPDYDFDREENIPTADATVLQTNSSVLDKGFRSQASSIPRMLVNHFFGRTSYNLNKVNDVVNSFLYNMNTYIGSPNGLATLDANGRIPFSQLPESAMEYKGNWDASTNTPELSDGVGTKGDFYIVTVAGTRFSTHFNVNDRVIYDGATWSRLPNGAVSSVNNVHPVNENVTLTGADIATSSSDSTKVDVALNSKQKNVVKITQADYDLLTPADKASNLYIITDSNIYTQSLIKDSVKAPDSTWSSDKIVKETLCSFGVVTPSPDSGELDVTVEDAPSEIYVGYDISVKFTDDFTYNGETTMSINSGDKYPVRIGNATVTPYSFLADRTYTFHFTGVYFDCISNVTNTDLTETIKKAILNSVYPVGSYYWSSESTDPSTFIGGTWEQIKDRFIYAKGDNTVVDTLGGNSTTTLSTENLPTHTHTIAHTHTLNSGNTASAGTKTTAGFRGVSAKTTTTGSNHKHIIYGNGDVNIPITIKLNEYGSVSGYGVQWGPLTNTHHLIAGGGDGDGSHTHTFTAQGYLYGKTDGASATNSGSTGSSTAINIMPPYKIAYCWHRIE